MALKAISQETKTYLKERLDFLECPYTEDLNAEDTANLLLNPGEERVKILGWLFSRFDSNLSDFLEHSKQNVGRKPEAQLKKLLTAACSMCLCSQDDLPLIMGEAPSHKQVAFLNRFLNIVCRSVKKDSGHYESSPNNFIDSLVSQDEIFDSSAWKIDIIPKDLQSEVKRVKLKQEQEEGQTLSGVPDLSQLTNQSQILSEELDKQNNILEELKKSVQVQGLDKSAEVVTMSQMLWTVLRELRQLVAGFTHCYESNIGVWCIKKPPQLSQLGASFKRVHGLLEKFAALSEDINTIHQLHLKLTSNKIGDELKQKMLVQASRNTSESFQKCLTILEETLHRTESNFTSQFPNLISV